MLGAESIAPVLYNRKFIYNFLLKIYGATAETTLRERIFKQQNALGGSCDSYDITKLNTGTDSDPMSTCYGEELKPQVGINSSIREGWIIRACEEVGKIDSAIYFALNQIFPDNVMTTDVPMVNEEGVKAAFHLFYPTLEGNQDLIKALFDLKQREVLAVDQWKLILTTLCQSPEWRK